jgi:hypothetical protein
MNYQWHRNETNILRKISDTYMINSTNALTDNKSELDVVVRNEMRSVTTTLTVNSACREAPVGAWRAADQYPNGS